MKIRMTWKSLGKQNFPELPQEETENLNIPIDHYSCTVSGFKSSSKENTWPIKTPCSSNGKFYQIFKVKKEFQMYK